MPLVELTRAHDRAQIDILQSVVADAGIESFVFGRETVLLVPARLMVLDEDQAEASRLLIESP